MQSAQLEPFNFLLNKTVFDIEKDCRELNYLYPYPDKQKSHSQKTVKSSMLPSILTKKTICFEYWLQMSF